MDQRVGTAAGLSIAGAIGCFLATFTGHPIGGLFLAIAAILLGLVGFVMSASPRVSGGILSIIAIVLSIFGIGASVLGMIGRVVF